MVSNINRLPNTRRVGTLSDKLGTNYVYLLKDNISLPYSSDCKECACNAGDPASIPGLGRSLGERYGNPLQHSCLGNSMERGAWWTTVHGVQRVGHS